MKQERNEEINSIVIKIIFVMVIVSIWEFVAKSDAFGPSSELIFPSLEIIAKAFINNFIKGYAGTSLWIYISNSMLLLLEGLLLGMALSFVLSGLSIISKTFYAIYDLLISIFDLLP